MHHAQRLSNGLRLVTIPLHDTKAITVFVLVKVGSRYETRAINGASHFLEHLMFKGTKQRPSPLAITKLLDGVGASYNAFTSKDVTGYYVKINAERTELALDVLADITSHSLFRPAEINRERGVIAEEIKMYDENPVLSIEDLHDEVLFGRHHPLGWSVLGPRAVIDHISRAALLRYKDRYYHAGNIWVVAAGRLPEHMSALVKKYFSGFPARRAATPFARYRPAAGPIVRLQHRATEQVQLALGMLGLRYQDPKLPALSVLSNILGGTMSSRLFVQIREKRGLAYSVQASVSPYEDTGAVTISAGLDKDKAQAALRVILQELQKFRTAPVTAAELRRAKEYLRGRAILDLEDSSALAGWYGRRALFGKTIQDPSTALKKIAAVTAADVQAVANKLFRPARYRLALIGPFRDERPWQLTLLGR